jgi:hypothetical protein
MIFAIGSIILCDALICGTDQDPSIEHARMAEFDKVA